MAVEIAKARRSSTQLQGIVHLSANGTESAVLDIRTCDGRMQAKLEIRATDNVAWFALEPGDSLFLERRSKARGTTQESMPAGTKTHPKVKSIDLATDSLEYPAKLTCADGTHGDVVFASKSKDMIRITIIIAKSGTCLCRIMQPGDKLTVESAPHKPRRPAANAGAESFGNSLRAQFARRVAEAAATAAQVEMSNTTATPPAIKILPRRESYLLSQHSQFERSSSQMAAIMRRKQRTRVLLFSLIVAVPVALCGMYIYRSYRYYNPIMAEDSTLYTDPLSEEMRMYYQPAARPDETFTSAGQELFI